MTFTNHHNTHHSLFNRQCANNIKFLSLRSIIYTQAKPQGTTTKTTNLKINEVNGIKEYAGIQGVGQASNRFCVSFVFPNRVLLASDFMTIMQPSIPRSWLTPSSPARSPQNKTHNRHWTTLQTYAPYKEKPGHLFLFFICCRDLCFLPVLFLFLNT